VALVAGVIAASPVTSALVSHSRASSAAGGGLPGAPSPFFSHLTDINAQVGGGVILDALAAALVIALLASAATTWTIGRIQPAEALRSE
jgi:ABC-type lipoprotein release transport system permease subunit